MNSISVFAHRIAGALLGMILLLAALLMTAIALVAASVVAVAAIAWARLRGVPMTLRGDTSRRRGEVVDVQVREVPDADR